MKLTIEGTQEELQEKREQLLKALVDEFRTLDPELATILQKAIPRREPQLKFRVLRQLHEQTKTAYKEQLQKLVDDIEAVLNTEPVQGKKVTPKPERMEKISKAKVSKEEANYIQKARDPMYACEKCRFFELKGEDICTKVEGKIAPKASCDLFKPFQKSHIPESVYSAADYVWQKGYLWARCQEAVTPENNTSKLRKGDFGDPPEKDEEPEEPGVPPPDPDIDEESGDPIIDPTTGLTPTETKEAKESGELEEEEETEKASGQVMGVVQTPYHQSDLYGDLGPQRFPVLQKGPFIGPQGGKWADPQRTIPWRGPQHKIRKKEPELDVSDPDDPLEHDHTKVIADREQKKYSDVQRELIKRGYKPADFERGGTLYGASNNELINFLESLKANNGGE